AARLEAVGRVGKRLREQVIGRPQQLRRDARARAVEVETPDERIAAQPRIGRTEGERLEEHMTGEVSGEHTVEGGEGEIVRLDGDLSVERGRHASPLVTDR